MSRIIPENTNIINATKYIFDTIVKKRKSFMSLLSIVATNFSIVAKKIKRLSYQTLDFNIVFYSHSIVPGGLLVMS